MSTPRVRLGFLLGLILLASLVGGSAVATRRSHANDEKQSRLHELLCQKLAILERVAANMEELHKLREVGPKELYEAHLAVHRAQLDLCGSDPERIEVLEKLLTEAKRREKTVMDLPRGGSPLGVPQAHIDRLDVEIEIERLKAK